MKSQDPGREAAIPNPKLAVLARLVGTWSTSGRHPLLPGVSLHGRTSFAWIEGGAFLIMRTEIDEPEIPSGIAIFGSDDATGECFMLYFDEREVSRKYDVSVRPDGLTWQRNAPGFSQRMNLTMSPDGDAIVSRGEYSKDGATWEGDLELTYRRIPNSIMHPGSAGQSSSKHRVLAFGLDLAWMIWLVVVAWRMQDAEVPAGAI